MQFFIDSLLELNIFIVLCIFMGFCTLIFLGMTLQRILYFFVISYVLILFDILFLLRNNGISDLVMTPFHTIFELFKDDSVIMVSVIIYNIVSNILIFLPIGIFLPIFFSKKSNKYIFSLGIFIIAFVEFLQFLLGKIFSNFSRITDIDDVIFGIFGFFLGFLFFILIKNKNPFK